MTPLAWAWLRRHALLAAVLPLLACTLWLQAALLPRWQAQRAAAEQAARQAERHAVALRARWASRPLPMRWRDTLPDADARVQRLATVLGEARRQGLTVIALAQQVDPRPDLPAAGATPSAAPADATPAEAPGALRIDLQLRGRYAAVRGLLQAVLAADPALAVNRLRLSRTAADDTATAPGVQAELQLLLFERDDGAPAPTGR